MAKCRPDRLKVGAAFFHDCFRLSAGGDFCITVVDDVRIVNNRCAEQREGRGKITRYDTAGAMIRFRSACGRNDERVPVIDCSGIADDFKGTDERRHVHQPPFDFVMLHPMCIRPETEPLQRENRLLGQYSFVEYDVHIIFGIVFQLELVRFLIAGFGDQLAA